MSALVQKITNMLHQAGGPMRATEIARRLDVPRSAVNAVLYDGKDATFIKRDDLTWQLAAKLNNARVPAASSQITVTPHFAPDGSPLKELCKEIDRSHSEILIQAFYLRSELVAKALVRAKKRGVKVRILLGCTNSNGRGKPEKRHGGRKHCVPASLHAAKIEVREDWGKFNNHNKCVIIDRKITITGGLNLCERAEKNSDNIVIIRDSGVAGQFVEDWFLNHAQNGASFVEDAG